MKKDTLQELVTWLCRLKSTATYSESLLHQLLAFGIVYHRRSGTLVYHGRSVNMPLKKSVRSQSGHGAARRLKEGSQDRLFVGWELACALATTLNLPVEPKVLKGPQFQAALRSLKAALSAMPEDEE